MKDFDDSLNKSQQYLMDTIARSQASSGLKGSHTQHKTLRDEFAMAAMNGIQSNSAVEYNPKDMAERAYWIADEMLIAREVQS